MCEKKVFFPELKGQRRRQQETQHICNMSGGAAKRAKPVEKTVQGEAVLNEQIAGDGKALHEAMYLLPQGLRNVASSGQSVVDPPLAQVGEKRSLEPDYKNFDYELEKQKLQIREKNIALDRQEQLAKLEVAKAKLDVAQKEADIEHQKVTDSITSRIFGLKWTWDAEAVSDVQGGMQAAHAGDGGYELL